MATTDLLFTIFEHHLFNALVEDESHDEFLETVVRDYLARLSRTGVILAEHRSMIETDLREEVLEMLRKKTYGHYNLSEFRKSHAKKAPKPAPRAPRGARRAS